MGDMSYNVTVEVAEGTATVTTSGEVPDGEFTIHGHEDATRREIGVTRRGADGRYIAAANSTHYKEG